MGEVQRMPEPEPQRSVALTPMQMLQYAVENGRDVAVVEKMMLLAERWEANQARRAFDEAMAAAKAEMPVITKNRTVDFTSQKGRTHYRHEDLGEIARVVSPILGRYGLSYRFRTKTERKTATVTCIITHRDGHLDDANTLSCAHDDSGNKNAIQQMASAITYLQRMTLKAALGLAASNDDDGNTASTEQSGPRLITDEQVTELRELLFSTGGNLEGFLKAAKVGDLSDILAKNYGALCQAIRQRSAKRKEAGNGA